MIQWTASPCEKLVLICVGVEKKRIMYQPKVDVDKLNAVKVLES